MKINGRVRLCDLKAISQEEFALASLICQQISQIRESRALYIREHGLDPEIALPGGSWEEGTSVIQSIYQFVVEPKYAVINRLRLYCIFSGYQLASFSNAFGKSPILHLIPENFDERLEKLAPSPDGFVYGYIAQTRCVPAEIRAKSPKILGEVGWDIDGYVVNADTFAYQEYLNILYESGIIDWLYKRIEEKGRVNILEIGAGYGGLAYHLKHIIPQSNYFICDIPESLLFSALYLSIACPEYRSTIYDGSDKSMLGDNGLNYKFVPNFMFDDLLAMDLTIDLAINTQSLSEMAEKQVRYYGRSLSHMLGSTGVLFEENDETRLIHPIDCKLYLPEYFSYRRTIPGSTVPILTRGRPDIWANNEITDIVLPRLEIPLRYRLYKKIYQFYPRIFAILMVAFRPVFHYLLKKSWFHDLIVFVHSNILKFWR